MKREKWECYERYGVRLASACRKNQLHTMPGSLTAVHGSLQTQQQVGQPGLPGPRQAGVQAAALLPQVQFAGFGQGVTDSVVLRDQLLTDRQSVTALRRKTMIADLELRPSMHLNL